jgi:hypothetical protein
MGNTGLPSNTKFNLNTFSRFGNKPCEQTSERTDSISTCVHFVKFMQGTYNYSSYGQKRQTASAFAHRVGHSQVQHGQAHTCVIVACEARRPSVVTIRDAQLRTSLFYFTSNALLTQPPLFTTPSIYFSPIFLHPTSIFPLPPPPTPQHRFHPLLCITLSLRNRLVIKTWRDVLEDPTDYMNSEIRSTTLIRHYLFKETNITNG